MTASGIAVSPEPVPARDPGDRRWWPLVALVCILIIAALLRFRGLGAESLWWDEGATWRQVNGSLLDVISRTATDTYPPGYNVFAWASRAVVGDSELALRLPAAVFGLLTVVAVYWLTRMTSSRAGGLVAATIIAVAPFAVFYAQEARTYSLLMLASGLFAATLLWIIARPGWLRVLAHVASGVLLLYSHPYGLLGWVSALAGAAFVLLAVPSMRAAFRYLLVGEIAVALLFSPWALILLNVSREVQGNGFWIDRPTILTVLYAFKVLLSGYQAALLMLVLWVAAAVFRRRIAAIATSDTRTLPLSVSLPILLALAVGPIVIGLAVSIVGTPIFLNRYLSVSLPAIVAIAGMGAAALAITARYAVIVLAATLVIMSSAVATDSMSHGENWRGAAQYVSARMKPDDCLYATGGSAYQALLFYLHDAPVCAAQGNRIRRLAKLPATATRLFVVTAHGDETTRNFRKVLPQGKWTAEVERFGGVTVTVFSKR